MLLVCHSQYKYYQVLTPITFFLVISRCFMSVESLFAGNIFNNTVSQSHFDSRKNILEVHTNDSTPQQLSTMRYNVTPYHKLLRNKRKPEMRSTRIIDMSNLSSELDYDVSDIDTDYVEFLVNTEIMKNEKENYEKKLRENKQIAAGYLHETDLDGLKSRKYIENSTAMYHSNIKRGFKERRFLSNVHSSLKEHIKGGKQLWKMTKKEVIKAFDKYYECVGLRITALKSVDFPIKALLAVEGEQVEMTCHVCYRPDQSEESQMALWQVLRHETSSLEKVNTDKRISISKDYTLRIDSVDIGDSGQYFCLEKRDYADIYQLDVFLNDKRRSVKLGEEQVLPDTYLIKHNLHIFTMWAPWHECNTCDRPGTKTRVGQCSVKKIYQDIPIFPRDYPLMDLYPEGVPCHSTALPHHLRKIPEIGERESETQVCPCEESCPTDPPMTQVTDETGKVVEVIEPGFYSMKEKPPVLPPIVIKKVLFEPEKSHLVLKCPSDSKAHLIYWMRHEREVDPNEIKKLTKGRVWVDAASRLHIKPLLLSDTDVYNCFSKNVKVASMKIIVVNEGNKKLKFYISFAGLGATIIGSLICMFCICCKKSDKNAK